VCWLGRVPSNYLVLSWFSQFTIRVLGVVVPLSSDRFAFGAQYRGKGS